MQNEIERIFTSDIRQKKRTGNGIHHKTGTRGLIGSVKFATDLMTPKQRRQYIQGGSIVSWNAKQVLSKDKFETYTQEQQVEMMKAWRVNFTVAQICEGLGIREKSYYYFLTKMGFPKESLNGSKRKATTAVQVVEAQPIVKKPINTVPTPAIVEGLNFNLNGTYDAETLSNWLSKLSLLTDGIEKMDVVIHIRESK